jgi:predicted CopG family antitoxin
MRKKLTLTIDADVYEMIKDLPRKVSISEIISWFLKSMLEDIKRGGLTQEEFEKWVKSTPEGRDFRERGREQFGPTIRKMDVSIEKLKKAVKPRKGKK